MKIFRKHYNITNTSIILILLLMELNQLHWGVEPPLKPFYFWGHEVPAGKIWESYPFCFGVGIIIYIWVLFLVIKFFSSRRKHMEGLGKNNVTQIVGYIFRGIKGEGASITGILFFLFISIQLGIISTSLQAATFSPSLFLLALIMPVLAVTSFVVPPHKNKKHGYTVFFAPSWAVEDDNPLKLESSFATLVSNSTDFNNYKYNTVTDYKQKNKKQKTIGLSYDFIADKNSVFDEKGLIKEDLMKRTFDDLDENAFDKGFLMWGTWSIMGKVLNEMKAENIKRVVLLYSKEMVEYRNALPSKQYLGAVPKKKLAEEILDSILDPELYIKSWFAHLNDEEKEVKIELCKGKEGKGIDFNDFNDINNALSEAINKLEEEGDLTRLAFGISGGTSLVSAAMAIKTLPRGRHGYYISQDKASEVKKMNVNKNTVRELWDEIIDALSEDDDDNSNT